METADLETFADAVGRAAGCAVGDPVYVAVWGGWGLHQQWPQGALFRAWRHDCLLFQTAWRAGDTGIAPAWPGNDDPAPPTYWWPPDRSWCVFTDIDFDSTILTGPESLCATLVESPDVEATYVPADADLTRLGDRLNPG